MINTHTLSGSDQIIATLQGEGKILATISKKNFQSIDEIVNFMINIAGKFIGLAKLTIRNRTQGWTMNMALSAKRQTSTATLAPSLSMPREGRQYLIPW